MKCINEETYIKYENNLLNPSEKRNVEKHLESCKACHELFEEERIFDSGLKDSLKKDHRIRGFANMVLEKIHAPKSKRGLIGKLAVAGGIMWCMAVFNAITVSMLFLYLNDFSMTNVVISIKDIIMTAGMYFVLYLFYLKIVSASIYTAFILAAILILSIQFKHLKPLPA